MPVEYSNFFSLLSAGAFGTPLEIEPMSLFKWQRLIEFARIENLDMPVRFALQGTFWSDILSKDQRVATSEIEHYRQTIYQKYEYSIRPQTTFSSVVMRLKIFRIYQHEIHSIDTSMATLGLLDLICTALKETLIGIIPLKEVVMIGLYLRQKGDQVDFVKLELYISELGLRKAVNLFGTLLIKKFHFSPDEIPFFQKIDKNAERYLDAYYQQAYTHYIDDRHRALTGRSLANSGYDTLRKSSNRGLQHAKYHRAEALHHYIKNLFHNIRDIDE